MVIKVKHNYLDWEAVKHVVCKDYINGVNCHLIAGSDDIQRFENIHSELERFIHSNTLKLKGTFSFLKYMR